MLMVKTVLCEFALKTSSHISFLKIGCLFMLVYSFIVVSKNCYDFKDIDMSTLPIEKFIILTEDVALLTKIFMGMKANLVQLMWFVKYLFYCFCSRFKFEKNVFKIDIPPSFLLSPAIALRISSFLGLRIAYSVGLLKISDNVASYFLLRR